MGVPLDRCRRWSLGFRLAAVTLCFGAVLWCHCDATPQGSLMVEYRFETPEGVALTCADLGAAMLEVTLFERDNDVLPYDRQHVPCEMSAEGVGVVAWRVEALPYARLVVRVVGQGGGTVRVCVEGRTEEATTLISPCIVTQGAPSQQEWTLRAHPGGCV